MEKNSLLIIPFCVKIYSELTFYILSRSALSIPLPLFIVSFQGRSSDWSHIPSYTINYIIANNTEF